MRETEREKLIIEEGEGNTKKRSHEFQSTTENADVMEKGF